MHPMYRDAAAQIKALVFLLTKAVRMKTHAGLHLTTYSPKVAIGWRTSVRPSSMHCPQKKKKKKKKGHEEGPETATISINHS